MPVQWVFRCYISKDGTDEIRAWYERQSRKVQARFLSRLKGLSSIPFDEWNDTLHKALHGECRGLNEIRFKADRVQRRQLGFRSGEYEFTILLCAIEKGNKFIPASACKIALARKSEVKKEKDRTNGLWLALE